MTKKVCLAVALLACFLFVATGAFAQPVCIGLQEAGTNGGAITNEGCVNNSSGANSFIGSYGTFTLNVGAEAVPFPGLVEPDEQSDTIGGTSSGPGTINIFITVQNENLDNPNNPPAVNNLISKFTDNGVNSGWTVTETTWYDPSNGLFTEISGDKLGSATFTGTLPQASQSVGTTVLLSNSWSETIEYTIAATGTGGFTDTVDIVPTPEPASIALFGSGLLGLVGVARRRFLR